MIRMVLDGDQLWVLVNMAVNDIVDGNEPACTVQGAELFY
jgi:hypothetical protein